MKNFKYIFAFSLFFNLVSNVHAVFIDGRYLDTIHEETSFAPRTSILLKAEGKKGDEPSLKVKWLKLSKKKSDLMPAHSTDSIPTKSPPQGSKLKRAFSTRDTKKDKMDAPNGSTQEVSTAPIPRRDVKKGNHRKRAVTSVSTHSNPLHKQQPLGVRRELQSSRSSRVNLSLTDFTAGSDTTLRGIDLSLAQLSVAEEEPTPSSSPILVPLFPSQDSVDLKGNNGTITFAHDGALQRQYFTGLKVDNYIEVLFSGVCQIKVYPADQEKPLILCKGHFDPIHSKLDVKFRNCGKIQVLPPEQEKD